jgi:hypothetical protein
VPGDVASRLGADVVIAVRVGTPQAGSVSAAAAGASPSDLSMLRIALTSIDLMQAHMQSHTSGAATIRIEPDFPAGGGVAMHHFPHGRRFIEVGEAAAEAARPQLGAALPFLRP